MERVRFPRAPPTNFFMGWFHQHRWRITGVHHLQRHFMNWPGMVMPITEVLRVCECGEVSTTTLEGTWTLEQLQMKVAAKDAEFLHNLGVKS
jgi:hypothetical protein